MTFFLKYSSEKWLFRVKITLVSQIIPKVTILTQTWPEIAYFKWKLTKICIFVKIKIFSKISNFVPISPISASWNVKIHQNWKFCQQKNLIFFQKLTFFFKYSSEKWLFWVKITLVSQIRPEVTILSQIWPEIDYF